MIKVVVFDFDGVLVDSNSLKRGAFYDLLVGIHGITKKMVDDTWAEIDGQNKTRFEFIRVVFSKIGKSGGELEGMVKDYSEKYDEIVQKGIKSSGLITGAWETLENLSKTHHIYIDSATPDGNLQKTADMLGIRKFFKGIHGKEVMGFFTSKDSKKTILKKIMELEKVSGGEVLFVGDGEADREAAEAYSCRFIGIANDFNGWTDHEKFKTIRSVAELTQNMDI